MTCVETRALWAQEMEGISTPLSAAACAPRKMVFSSYARAKAQYCGFFGPLCPQTPKKRRRNDSKGSRKYRYKGQCRSGAMQCNATQRNATQRNARQLRSVGQVRWGPAESRRSFHQLVDRFPLGVDGSLQFPRLPHCLVANTRNVSGCCCCYNASGVFQTYRADCNSMTSICA